jgi:tetratricopeptide (TPR) repeat protein
LPLRWTLARALIAQGRTAEAEARIRRAATEVGDGPHYVLLARVLSMLDKRDKAETMIAQAQAIAPRDPEVWAACADFWGSLSDRNRQIAASRKAIELRGDDPAQSLALARLLGPSGSPDDRAEALAIVRSRLADDPRDFAALILDAELALNSDPPDFSRAEASLERALAVDARSAEAYRLMAATNFRSGELEAASEAVAAGLAFIPDDPDLLLIAAELYCFHGEYLKAVTPLRHLLQVQPRHPQAVRLLATAYTEVGRVDDAMAFVDELAPPEARTATELLIQARLSELAGDVSQAESLYKRANELDATSVAVLALAQFYARQEDYDEVQSLGLRHQSESPDDPASLAVIAELLGAQSSDEELRRTGMAWLEKLARDNPGIDADARYRLGMCHYRHRDFARAERELTKAAELSPQTPVPVNALAWMYAEDLDRLDDARAVIDRFLESGGTPDASLLDTHGLVLIRLGKLAAAAEKLTKCIRVAGQTPTLAAAHYRLGLVYLKQDNLPTAISYIKTALRLAQRLGGLTAAETERATELIERSASNRRAQRP